MNVVMLSDTHNLHRHYGRKPFGDIPPGDLVIHAGDCTTHGSLDEFETFMRWFSGLPHRHKVMVGGNHDRCLEGYSADDVRRDFPSVTYLLNEAITIDGVSIFGSPYSRKHHDFAFGLVDDLDAARVWGLIPVGTDLLITHGPPFGVLDKGHGEENIGCPVLDARVAEIRPKLHVFGHAHESFGFQVEDGITFANAVVHPWLWKTLGPRHPLSFEVSA